MILIVMQRTWPLIWNPSSKIPAPTRMEECNGQKYMVYENR